MELRVHEVCQFASGGSHVTIYDADVVLVQGSVRVDIAGVDPKCADPGAVEEAREAIRRGAEQVLQQRGLGAIIRVKRLVIHPIDFKPRRFEQHTVEELRRLLEDSKGQA